MKVRLTRKLAQRLDDIDLAGYLVGDILELPKRSARLLILEGWAEQVSRETPVTPYRSIDSRRAPEPNRKPD
jgi:hypothetical protein